MDEETLRALVDGIRSGVVDPDDAIRTLRRLPFVDLGMARIDHHRSLRQGLPEAVYAPGKQPAQCGRIVQELLATGAPVVLTRATREQVDECPAACTIAETGEGLHTVVWQPAPQRSERVVIVSAGTADWRVAAECAATLRAYGVAPATLTDCGVAGLHRLLPHVDELAAADAIVTVAGMEGALASVVGGITSAPVVAVPTSVGYGSSMDGITALLAMLSSCAAGVSVVGIDNGYGAACAVMRILGARSRGVVGVGVDDARRERSAGR